MLSILMPASPMVKGCWQSLKACSQGALQAENIDVDLRRRHATAGRR